MNRIAQGLVTLLLGAAVLGSTVFSDLYLNYVKALFQPFLILTGLMLVVLGGWIVASDVRASLREDGGDAGPADTAGDEPHGHDHSRAPRVAWLLVLPVISVFVIAPPALGAYSAAETTATSAGDTEGDSNFDELDDSSGPIEMEVQDFVSRAWTDEERSMSGREIELTGFAVPNSEGEGWYLARLQMACCAADAVVNRVLITDEPEPEKDSWWTVRGTWDEPEGDIAEVRDHRFTVEEMTEVENPPDPYE
ncbi:putative repeat protein (TIGR03943 family) [Lipingzhangella halophila]|uniref:Putative repeat protein (TIGR03943 family) n=1 Tax=Lipingzhangella halophila TaxID=1783352 RepID=A0A7W7W3W7_9ACTN|nr:TIGR03943 family protein [Lipingzhangella halophila]MBB4932115.1 putative repeat protein (TIGR03943 family) [Lipingzhangella halophila]